MRHVVLLLPCLFTATALATPVQVTVQTRALDATGNPANGTMPVIVQLLNDEDGEEYGETFPTATVSDGYVSLTLGADTQGHPMQHTVFDVDPLFVQFTVDGQVQEPPQRLGSVPSAISVSGGTVDAASITVAGGLTLGTVADCATQADGTLFLADNSVFVCLSGQSVLVGGRVGIGLENGARRFTDGTSAASCRAYLDAETPYEFTGDAATDGLYWVDPDGTGAGTPVQVYCDQSTDGGGWQLMLSYNHSGNVTTGAADSGAPTALTGSYTHRYLNTMGYPSASVVQEVRFYCTTNQHSRVIHFKTANSITRTDIWDGGGTSNIGAWTSGFTTLAGHTANLPGGTDASYSGGSRAMLDFPFYNGGDWHWAIGASDNRWECDDFPGDARATTVHRIWWR